MKDMLMGWLIVRHGEEVTVLNRVLDIMDDLVRNSKKDKKK